MQSSAPSIVILEEYTEEAGATIPAQSLPLPYDSLAVVCVDSQLIQMLHGCNWVWLPENGRSCYKSVSPGGSGIADRGGINSAVDLEPLVVAQSRAQLLNLWQDLANEGLATEPGPNAHHQDHVDRLDNRIDRAERRGWIQRNADRSAQATNVPDNVRGVVGHLDVKSDQITTGLDEGFGVSLGFLDHQVGVKKQLGVRS